MAQIENNDTQNLTMILITIKINYFSLFWLCDISSTRALFLYYLYYYDGLFLPPPISGLQFYCPLIMFLEFRRSFDSSYRRYLFLEFIFNFAPFPDKESGCKAFLSIGSLLSIFYFTQVAGFRAWYLFYWNQFLCEIFILMKCFWQPFPYFGEPWTPLCSLFYYYLFLNQKI